MLHNDPFIISSDTFSLIKELQQFEEFASFFLVGGTALALKLGHRNSIDIDLFTRDEFSSQFIIDTLNAHFSFELSKSFKGGLLGFINDIKVDFIRHDYKLINTPIYEEGIAYLSLEDIAAMKLHAIINSGKRLKDFIDIYFLLERFSLEEMLTFYALKYPNFNPVIPVRAINYFEDLDLNLDPPKLLIPLDLSTIKARIQTATLHSTLKF
jgi:hypothetical protein